MSGGGGVGWGEGVGRCLWVCRCGRSIVLARVCQSVQPVFGLHDQVQYVIML